MVFELLSFHDFPSLTFLLRHRYFVASYEKALRDECFYPGAQPYWDWTLDSNDFPNSPIFDPLTGFGGNGKNITVDPTTLPISSPFIPGGTGGGCVKTGWFKNWMVNVGPYDNLAYNPHCLARDFHPMLAQLYMTAPLVAGALAQPDLASFQNAVEVCCDIFPFQHSSDNIYHAVLSYVLMRF